MHTGVCRVPDPRPYPYKLHRGPLDGGPLHRKIRPPGASRRRATDNHVTLLPYRYQSRRHNTARPTYHRRYASCRTEWGTEGYRGVPSRTGGRRGALWGREEKGKPKESSSILGSEPVQYLPSSVHSRTPLGGDRPVHLSRSDNAREPATMRRSRLTD